MRFMSFSPQSSSPSPLSLDGLSVLILILIIIIIHPLFVNGLSLGFGFGLPDRIRDSGRINTCIFKGLCGGPRYLSLYPCREAKQSGREAGDRYSIDRWMDRDRQI